jgi:hypothetical protein
MNGTINHLVAARPANLDQPAFEQSVAKILGDIQKQIPLEGAIACIGNDYFVYWELGSAAPGVKTGPTGVPLLQALLTGWSKSFAPAPTYLPIDLWDEWAGMDVRAGSSLNMQFEREPAE